MINESISVVIPVYNDFEVLDELHKRLMPVITNLTEKYELIFVNDGSKDKSLDVLVAIANNDSKVKVINLTRNFGQSGAIFAGLDNCTGELIVIMDSDLQDKPEDIPILIDALLNSDFQMAISCWKSRNEPLFRKITSKLFNYTINKITGIKRDRRMGMFRVIRKKVIADLKKIPERTSYFTSLVYWSGFKYIPVELERDPRFAGKSGYNIYSMLRLATDIIFSYSLFPIRVASVTGAVISIFAFLAGLYLIYDKLYGSFVMPGWTSIIALVLFLFGLQFIFLGIIGEYLGRIFLETKQRPRYMIESIFSYNQKELQ
jgi:polyisoprenyl-phosphate glycosyltransferase